MIPDRLQYFLDDFWNDKKCDQIWTLGPRTYHQHTSKNTRTIWERPWQNLFHIWWSGIVKMLEGMCAERVNFYFWILGIMKFEHFENSRFGALKFEMVKVDISKLRSSEIEKMKRNKDEVWKINVNIEKLEIGNWEMWKLENWKSKFENPKHPST